MRGQMAKEIFVEVQPETNDTADEEFGEQREFGYRVFATYTPEGSWHTHILTISDKVPKLERDQIILDSDATSLSQAAFPDCTFVIHKRDLVRFRAWCTRSNVTIVGERHVGYKDNMSLDEFLKL